MAETYKIVGCYAQTEMGHGSDVQNLETIAEFDLKTDEFILSSPTLTSAKMWPGDLGIFSTHALVFAQLKMGSIHHGVHPFLVPIRDLEKHEPFEGVEVGDIGPKFGYGTKDNGFLRLNKVRIPRDHMLMKYAKVTRNGEFKRVGNPRVLYGVMMEIRSNFAINSFRQLGLSLTVAIRYSLVRTQFMDDNKKERKILDFQLQQEKLFPLLAQFYAMAFAGQKFRSMVEKNSINIGNNDFSSLQETHIALSGAKAYCTSTIFLGNEKCRLSCGGHGFSHYSGLVSLHQDAAANCTLEGENTVMFLQVAKYMMKILNRLNKKQSIPEDFEYLHSATQLLSEKCHAENESEVSSIDTLRKLLIVNVFYLLKHCEQIMIENYKAGKSNKETIDKKIGIFLVEAARAHSIFFTFKCFSDDLRKIQDENIRTIMTNLCKLYAIHEILEKPLSIIESCYLKNVQIKLLQRVKEKIFIDIRPYALVLVDAILFSDNTLRSALGTYNGNVYETMFDWAQNKNSFNAADGMEHILKLKNVVPLTKL